MPVHNSEIADLFDRYADLLEIEEANPFRVRAYRNAALAIRGNPKSMADLIEEGMDLTELPAIGEDLAKKIHVIVETGRLPQLEKAEKRVPSTLIELMRIEGLGPKRVKVLHRELGISNFDDLKRALRLGTIRQLKGFGEKTEQRIRERLAEFAGEERRLELYRAEEFAQSLVDYLRRNKAVKEVIVAGSYRRRRETVGDLDILIAAKQGPDVMDYFVRYDEVATVISKGDTRARVRLRSGLSVDLRVVPEESYGAALHYFTGCKAHSIAMRKLAMDRGCKLNEYGVFRGKKRIAGRTEEEVYASVSLPWIPPELREDHGELEAAAKHRLPKLVTLDDIRGDLHCHTSATDGHNTLKEMAQAAKAKGYEYLSINDHSRHVTVAHGLDGQQLLKQIKAIDKLNERLDGIVILKSIEVDILEDGTLDLPDSVLKHLDFTVCAVHYKFNLTEEKQTERLLRAMDNPLFNILAHPRGRLINRREPYRVNLETLMRGALDRGCYLELNAHPERLDLHDEGCRMAREMGLKVAVSTDAHSITDLDYLRFGLDQARRGWLEKKDILNTRPLGELLKLLKRK